MSARSSPCWARPEDNQSIQLVEPTLQLRALRDARQSRRRKRAGVRRGIPTYRFRWPERPRREPRRRVATPFYNNKVFTNRQAKKTLIAKLKKTLIAKLKKH